MIKAVSTLVATCIITLNHGIVSGNWFASLGVLYVSFIVLVGWYVVWVQWFNDEK